MRCVGQATDGGRAARNSAPSGPERAEAFGVDRHVEMRPPYRRLQKLGRWFEGETRVEIELRQHAAVGRAGLGLVQVAGLGIAGDASEPRGRSPDRGAQSRT